MAEDFSGLNRLRATFSTASPPRDPNPPPADRPPAPADPDTFGFPSMYGTDYPPDPWFTPSLAEVVTEADEGGAVVVNLPYFPVVPGPPKPDDDQQHDDQPDDEGAQ